MQWAVIVAIDIIFVFHWMIAMIHQILIIWLCDAWGGSVYEREWKEILDLDCFHEVVKWGGCMGCGNIAFFVTHDPSKMGYYCTLRNQMLVRPWCQSCSMQEDMRKSTKYIISYV